MPASAHRALSSRTVRSFAASRSAFNPGGHCALACLPGVGSWRAPCHNLRNLAPCRIPPANPLYRRPVILLLLRRPEAHTHVPNALLGAVGRPAGISARVTVGRAHAAHGTIFSRARSARPVFKSSISNDCGAFAPAGARRPTRGPRRVPARSQTPLASAPGPGGSAGTPRRPRHRPAAAQRDGVFSDGGGFLLPSIDTAFAFHSSSCSREEP